MQLFLSVSGVFSQNTIFFIQVARCFSASVVICGLWVLRLGKMHISMSGKTIQATEVPLR